MSKQNNNMFDSEFEFSKWLFPLYGSAFDSFSNKTNGGGDARGRLFNELKARGEIVIQEFELFEKSVLAISRQLGFSLDREYLKANRFLLASLCFSFRCSTIGGNLINIRNYAELRYFSELIGSDVKSLDLVSAYPYKFDRLRGRSVKNGQFIKKIEKLKLRIPMEVRCLRHDILSFLMEENVFQKYFLVKSVYREKMLLFHLSSYPSFEELVAQYRNVDLNIDLAIEKEVIIFGSWFFDERLSGLSIFDYASGRANLIDELSLVPKSNRALVLNGGSYVSLCLSLLKFLVKRLVFCDTVAARDRQSELFVLLLAIYFPQISHKVLQSFDKIEKRKKGDFQELCIRIFNSTNEVYIDSNLSGESIVHFDLIRAVISETVHEVSLNTLKRIFRNNRWRGLNSLCESEWEDTGDSESGLLGVKNFIKIAACTYDNVYGEDGILQEFGSESNYFNGLIDVVFDGWKLKK